MSTKRRSTRFLLPLVVMGLFLGVESAWALGVGAAPLPHDGTLYAPESLYPGLLGTDYYTVYPQSTVPSDYVSLDYVSSPHASSAGKFSGTLDSQVWQEQTTGELLFAYRLSNDAASDVSLHTVNIAGGWGQSPQWHTVDTGILDGQGKFPLTFQRYDDQVDIKFDAVNTSFQPVEELLQPGQSTDWMYIQTTALYYRTANATVQNGASSTGMIPTYAPANEPLIPEPLTVITTLLVVGGVGRYSYKRLHHQA